MRCPSCKSLSVYEHGFKQKGRQFYFCEDCQRLFTRKRRVKGLWVGLLLGLLALSPLILNWSLRTLLVSAVGDEPVDTIVVLGRGPKQNGERAAAAAQLWHEGRAPQVFISGMTDAPVMINLIREMGVPEDHIRGERCSQSTWENGLFSEILLSTHKPQRILLVTDEAHMARATLIFRDVGFEVAPYPTDSGISLKQGQLIIRESVGLIVYILSDKLGPTKSDQIQRAKAEATYKIKDWNCSLPKQESS